MALPAVAYQFKLFATIILMSLLKTVVSQQQSLPFVQVDISGDDTRTFQSPNANSYKTLLLESDVLYIGGDGFLFQQDPTNVNRSIHAATQWNPSKRSERDCHNLPQGNDETCRNYIRTVLRYNSSHLLLCGTMALKPVNQFYDIEHEEIVSGKELPPVALCSLDASDHGTSILTRSGEDAISIVATSRASAFQSQSLAETLPDGNTLQTTTGKGKMLEGNPSFVASFPGVDDVSGTRMEKLYFVFGEDAREPNSNKHSARIAQVCANDRGGGQSDRNLHQWTSYLKARLVCQTKEDVPFPFDVVKHMTVTPDGIMYGVFTTQSAEVRVSAVCAFRLSDIQTAFNSDLYWEQDDKTQQFRKKSKGSIQGQPGSCAQAPATSHDFALEFLEFIRSHPLVASTVGPVNPWCTGGSGCGKSGPLFKMNGEVFTGVVSQRVTAVDGSNYDVLFISTESGKLIKLVGIPDEAPVSHMISEFKISKEPIDGVQLSTERGLLYIQSSDVQQLEICDCAIYVQSCKFCDACRMCLLSRDPHCGWSSQLQECVPVKSTNATDVVQDIRGESPNSCPTFNTTMIVKNAPTVGTPVVTIGHKIKNELMVARWSRVLNDGQRLPLPSDSSLTHYDVTKGRLEINDFTSADIGTYMCEYETNGQVVALENTTFVVSVAPTPAGGIPIPPTETNRPGEIPDKRSDITPTGANNNSTLPPDVGKQPTVGEANITGIIVGVLVAIVLVLVIALYLRHWHGQKSLRCLGKKTVYTPGEQGGGVESAESKNENKNYNNHVQGKWLQQATPLLNSVIVDADEPDCVHPVPTVTTPRQVATVRPNNISRKSDTFPRDNRLDDDIMNPAKQVKSATPPTTRNGRTMERQTPQRSTSIPAQKVYVTLDNRKHRFTSIRKERNTWIFEIDDLPDTLSIDTGLDGGDDGQPRVESSSSDDDSTIRFSADDASTIRYADDEEGEEYGSPSLTEHMERAIRSAMSRSSHPSDSDGSTLCADSDSKSFAQSQDVEKPLLSSSYNRRVSPEGSAKSSPRDHDLDSSYC